MSGKFQANNPGCLLLRGKIWYTVPETRNNPEMGGENQDDE